jgi:hypothetical protein
MTLLQRARQEHSRSGFIETKREHGTSIFLSWWSDHSGTLYELRHGLYGGKTVLRHFVPAEARLQLKTTPFGMLRATR